MKKYEGREAVLKKIIPHFNCLWNDIVFLSPIDLSTVYDVLDDMGFPTRGDTQDYLKIPLDSLDPDKLLYYTYDNEEAELREDNCLPITYFKTPLTQLPDATLDYYHECKAQGTRPLVFHRVPHIFYKGTIDISQTEIMTWKRKSNMKQSI